MMRRFLTFVGCILACTSFAQQKIGLIDVYGHRKVAATAIRQAIKLSPGDAMSNNSYSIQTLRDRLKAVPGVQQAAIDLVCCDDSTGGAILYIGIGETKEQSFAYRTAPSGDFRLPASITSTYEAYMSAMIRAVKSGHSSEDHDAGYSLLQDTAARRLQLQFVPQALQYQQEISAVLHQSRDPHQRAIAAAVIAYGPDKRSIIQELTYAVLDSNEEVRNNAARALWILAGYLNQHSELNIVIPAAPFIRMLNSIVWTDRNKGSLVLFALTEKCPPALMAQLKKDCLPALTEMARWHNRGHAFQAYMLLGRMAGVSEEECFNTFNSHQRAAFLDRLLTNIHAR